MSERRITIILLDEELKALKDLAKIERREPRHQAAFVIRFGLHQMGLLKGDLSPMWQADYLPIQEQPAN